MIVLGIETSCDETGVALYHLRRGLLGHRLYSQVAMHADYGGVVPELASRDHIRKLLPLTEELLRDTGIRGRAVEGVAYTAGPGLIGALMVGACVARGLAWAWGVPVLGVHHMEGHLLAPLLEPQRPEPPYVALLVSGGHSMLVRVDALGRYRLLGDTLDDAVGEAFDKTAKLLGLGYPGGPALARLAERGRAGVFRFPRPMVDRPGLDMSFSGLKTAVLQARARAEPDAGTDADIARGFEEAVVETLTIKCRRALEQEGLRQLVVAGGVGANLRLRAALSALLRDLGGELFHPRPQFCTDNGAMIAHVGCLRMAAGQSDDGRAVALRPRWPLSELEPPA